MQNLPELTQQFQPLLDLNELPLNFASLMTLAIGVGWASGLRLYALIFILGMLSKFGGINLPGDLNILAHPLILTVSGTLLIVEFFADKIPWIDSLWDSVHTFIRIPAGATLAAAIMGDYGTATQIAFALIAGSITAGTHLAKTSTRAAVNTSPEPISNIISSFSEEVIFGIGIWTLLNYPLIFLILLFVFLFCAILIIFYCSKFLLGLLGKIKDKFTSKNEMVEY